MALDDRLERDGKVAVIYSPGYGAGWSTWANQADVEFDPDIALALLGETDEEAYDVAERKYPGVYGGGLDQAVVEWVPKGTRFRINEYDGNESIEYMGPSSFKEA